jgi:hypothetical protein
VKKAPISIPKMNLHSFVRKGNATTICLKTYFTFSEYETNFLNFHVFLNLLHFLLLNCIWLFSFGKASFCYLNQSLGSWQINGYILSPVEFLAHMFPWSDEV